MAGSTGDTSGFLEQVNVPPVLTEVEELETAETSSEEVLVNGDIEQKLDGHAEPKDTNSLTALIEK